MRQDGTVTARKGTSKVTVNLEGQMISDRYYISSSIVEPKAEDRPEDLRMEVLPGRTQKQFVIQFNMKLPVTVKIAYIAEHV